MAKKIYELTNIVTKEVSIVTNGANGKRFCVAKSADGELITKAFEQNDQEAISKLLPLLLEKASNETLTSLGIVEKQEDTKEEPKVEEAKVEKSEMDKKIEALTASVSTLADTVSKMAKPEKEEKPVEKVETPEVAPTEDKSVEKTKEPEVSKSLSKGAEDKNKTETKKSVSSYRNIKVGSKPIK